jgi:hypothetical protein
VGLDQQPAVRVVPTVADPLVLDLQIDTVDQLSHRLGVR